MIEIHLIHECICEYFKVGHLDVLKRCRKRDVVYKRQLFHYLCRELSNNRITYESIGSYLGDVIKPYGHDTVMNSVKKINNYLSYDKTIKKDVDNLKKMING